MTTDDAGKRWVIVHNEDDERIRRYPVPGGWLYQVEDKSMSGSNEGWHPHEGWHPPVFVASEDDVDGTNRTDRLERLFARIAEGIERLTEREP